VLRSNFLLTEQVEAVVTDFRTAGLTAAEVAMCAYAEKIALNAYKVTLDDIDGLRAHGFSDSDILDIALAASFRAMYSKLLDSIGVEPDAKYLSQDAGLLQVLAVGRALPTAPRSNRPAGGAG
jgi:hypothetical protein